MSFECFFFIRVERKKRGRLKHRTQKKKRERMNRTDHQSIERNEIETQCGQAALH